MSSFQFSKEKFLSFPLHRQHKNAAELLKVALIKDASLFPLYDAICSWMNLPVPQSREAYYDRYHEHLKSSLVNPQMEDFLPRMSQLDPISHEEYLPITIYLDNLRSAFNVGSILRTMEAFRIKSAYFAKNTPFIDQKKVQDTSMGTYGLIDCHRDLSKVKKPLIALELTQDAIPLYDYTFPDEFTLVLGNEEYGVSKEMLSQCSAHIMIPLVGAKNSLNVASAFSIAAYEMRRQIFTRNHSSQ